MTIEQSLTDTQVMLPILNEMISKELDNLNGISKQLVDIGEKSLAVSLIATDTQEKMGDTRTQLSDVLGNQRAILESLAQLSDAADKGNISDDVIESLNNNFASKLEEVTTLHAADKDMIVGRINEVYEGYTNRVVDLTSALVELKEVLLDPQYQDRIAALTESVVAVDQTLERVSLEYANYDATQRERVQNLHHKLDSLSEFFTAATKDTESNKQLISEVIQHMNLMEARLDALLAISEQRTTGGE